MQEATVEASTFGARCLALLDEVEASHSKDERLHELARADRRRVQVAW